jgi:hypothetical protein
MNKRIICIVVYGIFLMAIFSSANTNCKGNNVFNLSDTKNILFKNEVNSSSVNKVWAFYYSKAYGDFYVENGHVKGVAKIGFEFVALYFIIPYFNFLYNHPANVPINDTRDFVKFYSVKSNSHWVTIYAILFVQEVSNCLMFDE